MKRLSLSITLILVFILSFEGYLQASDWKLNEASLAEYKKLSTPEKEIASAWLSTLPDKEYMESFKQLVMGLALWSYKEPTVFLDYQFVKLFQTQGRTVDIYTFQAGDAIVSLEIYQPPIIPGDL